jgi:hypothetical protein
VLLFLHCSVSNSQDLVAGQTYTTDNLVGNTGGAWSGCYSNTSGSFWGGTSGGPCPGYDPSSGQIIFSYGQYTLSQTIAINQALAAAGSGLQINGYSYSWWVKNSNINGQQPGGYDPIAYIDVNLYSNTGSLLVGDRYNYGYYLPDWTVFSGTRTYDNPYSLSSLGNLQLSITSRDSGFWAGYYGPEFNNFNLRLNYSIDPCYNNPLYSTTCSGYGAAYIQAQQTSTPSTPIVTYNTSTGTSSITLVPDSTRTDPTVQNAGGVELTTTGTITPPDGIPTVSKEAVSTANNQSQTQEKEKREINPNALSTALSTIRRNAEREQSIVKDILQKNESETLQTRISQDALVGDLVSKTQEQSQSIALSAAVSSALSITNNSNRQNSDQTQNKNEDPSSTNFSMFGPANNIQNNIQTRLPETTNKESAGNSVNKNVQPNQAAGNVDIATIAQTPQGFELYMNGMRDGQFYTPKEIYRGQRTVDNARAERFLNGKSDVLHQRMIEQQYNIGN